MAVKHYRWSQWGVDASGNGEGASGRIAIRVEDDTVEVR